MTGHEHSAPEDFAEESNMEEIADIDKPNLLPT